MESTIIYEKVYKEGKKMIENATTLTDCIYAYKRAVWDLLMNKEIFPYSDRKITYELEAFNLGSKLWFDIVEEKFPILLKDEYYDRIQKTIGLPVRHTLLIKQL